MAYQVIKQPNGDLAIWSSYSDQFVLVDANEDDVMKFFVDIAIEDATRSTQRVLNAVVADDPARVYAQFAYTWDEVKHKYPPKGTTF